MKALPIRIWNGETRKIPYNNSGCLVSCYLCFAEFPYVSSALLSRESSDALSITTGKVRVSEVEPVC